MLYSWHTIEPCFYAGCKFRLSSLVSKMSQPSSLGGSYSDINIPILMGIKVDVSEVHKEAYGNPVLLVSVHKKRKN